MKTEVWKQDSSVLACKKPVKTVKLQKVSVYLSVWSSVLSAGVYTVSLTSPEIC